tara:strand:+ start:795 stop:1115 length:321 start_codon:yes stop_codon:yes gene_type:complete
MEVFDAALMVEDAAPKVEKSGIVTASGAEFSSITEGDTVITVRVVGVGEGYYIPESGKWMPLHQKVGDVIAVHPTAVFKARYQGSEFWRINAADVLFRVSKGVEHE